MPIGMANALGLIALGSMTKKAKANSNNDAHKPPRATAKDKVPAKAPTLHKAKAEGPIHHEPRVIASPGHGFVPHPKHDQIRLAGPQMAR